MSYFGIKKLFVFGILTYAFVVLKVGHLDTKKNINFF